MVWYINGAGLYLRSRSRLAIGARVVAVLLRTGLDEVGIQSGAAAAIATVVGSVASVTSIARVTSVASIVAAVATTTSSFQGAAKEGSSFDIGGISQESQADDTGENVLDLHIEKCEGRLQRKKKIRLSLKRGGEFGTRPESKERRRRKVSQTRERRK